MSRIDAEDPSKILAGYPVVVTVPVQWGDQDAFGHVNNTVFLRWMEAGRIAYFSEVRMVHDALGTGRGPILASVTCNFRRQVTFPDQVRIGSRVARIGTSSFVVEQAVASDRLSALVADGTSTVVHFDYAAGKSCPVPDEIRRAIEAIESSARGPAGGPNGGD
jgi:acyl-CoA thioester hydrolase